MPDLQELLLAHLQREARKKACKQATIEENELEIATSRQKTNESQTLLQCLKRINYEEKMR
jgi:hypothetical protein